MDQSTVEFLGFLALVVVLPSVAALLLARRIKTPLAAFAAVVAGSAALAAAAGEVYGVSLKLALARPEMEWSELWFLGGIFGGIAGLGCGALRAIDLVRRRRNTPDAETATPRSHGAAAPWPGAPDQRKRRRAELVAVGVLAVAVVVAVWVGRVPRSQGLTDERAAGVNADNFQRILAGMTAEEVNGIFGVPPGDYRRPPGFLMVGPGHVPWSEAARGGRLAVWNVPRYHAEVLYDRNDCVVGKYWHDAEAKLPSQSPGP